MLQIVFILILIIIIVIIIIISVNIIIKWCEVYEITFVTFIIIKINTPFSLSELLRLWLSRQLLCSQELNQLLQLEGVEMISNIWFVGFAIMLQSE